MSDFYSLAPFDPAFNLNAESLNDVIFEANKDQSTEISQLSAGQIVGKFFSSPINFSVGWCPIFEEHPEERSFRAKKLRRLDLRAQCPERFKPLTTWISPLVRGRSDIVRLKKEAFMLRHQKDVNMDKIYRPSNINFSLLAHYLSDPFQSNKSLDELILGLMCPIAQFVEQYEYWKLPGEPLPVMFVNGMSLKAMASKKCRMFKKDVKEAQKLRREANHRGFNRRFDQFDLQYGLQKDVPLMTFKGEDEEETKLDYAFTYSVADDKEELDIFTSAIIEVDLRFPSLYRKVQLGGRVTHDELREYLARYYSIVQKLVKSACRKAVIMDTKFAIFLEITKDIDISTGRFRVLHFHMKIEDQDLRYAIFNFITITDFHIEMRAKFTIMYAIKDLEDDECVTMLVPEDTKDAHWRMREQDSNDKENVYPNE